MIRHLRPLAIAAAMSAIITVPLDSPIASAASAVAVEARIAGENRYATANALALAAAVARGSGNTRHLVIASGTNFPDGLSAASLAGATDAVMLLTPASALPDSVADTIGQLRNSTGLSNTITTATIVGGESAVGAAVQSRLQALGLTVTRIQGSNRYATANSVAREAHRLSSTGIGSFDGLKTVFLATGENFPDSLAASSWSYRNVTPVLLSNGRALDQTTIETLQQLGVQQVLILGGTSVVSTAVESALGAVTGVTRVRRIQGANRYATATAIADALAEHDADYTTRALLVSGSSFPDALAAAPFAGQSDSYAIVPVASTMPTAISSWITANQSTLTAVRAIGGTSAVPQGVVDAASGREPAAGPGNGLTSVFMGHSFFQPPAFRLEGFAGSARLSGHSQTIVSAGGENGAPQGLWNDASKRAEIQALLSTGEVELLGMTYHPSFPTLDGYRLWFDEALKHNARTAFFIGMPWLLDPGTMTSAQYAIEWQQAYDRIIPPIVDGLRLEYPGTTIFAIPYGRAASVLYQLFDQGQLRGVTKFVGDARTSLFRDDMGHAGEIIDELAGLVWLRSIYCVDLTKFSFRSSYTIDLRGYGNAIVDQQNIDHQAPWCTQG